MSEDQGGVVAEQLYAEMQAGQEVGPGGEADDPFWDLPTRQDGFAIDDDGAADWGLRKIGEAEARMRRDRATAEAEAERWRVWQAKRGEQHQATIDRMQSLLSAYYDQLKASGMLSHKSKSYRLPSGVLQARVHEIQWVRKDADLLAWAKGIKGADLVETKESPRWAEIKKRVAPETNQIGAPAVDMVTGEYVPGLQVGQPSRDIFQAKAYLE